MALAIATNNAALNAAASASSVNRDMETSMARLSSGKRINSASDDAAGVAISSRLSAEIRGTDQSIRNALDGQALIDTAEGAHKEIENILQRMREVSVQAANDTNNDQDRQNLQAEMNALITEIDRIAGTTTWAGEKLMEDEQGSFFSFQVGAATGEKNQIDVTIDGMGANILGFATPPADDAAAAADGTLYTPDGNIYEGATHTMDGVTMSGATHSSDSVTLTTSPPAAGDSGNSTPAATGDPVASISGSTLTVDGTAAADGDLVLSFDAGADITVAVTAGDSVDTIASAIAAAYNDAAGAFVSYNESTGILAVERPPSSGGLLVLSLSNTASDYNVGVMQSDSVDTIASSIAWAFNSTSDSTIAIANGNEVEFQFDPSYLSINTEATTVTVDPVATATDSDVAFDFQNGGGAYTNTSSIYISADTTVAQAVAADDSDSSTPAATGDPIASIVGDTLTIDGPAAAAGDLVLSFESGDAITVTLDGTEDEAGIASAIVSAVTIAAGSNAAADNEDGTVTFDFSGMIDDYDSDAQTVAISADTTVAQAVAADDSGSDSDTDSGSSDSDTPAVVDVPTAPVTSVATADDARVTIKAIDKAIMTVNIQRSELGAVSNRLSHTVNNLTNISSNLSAAQGGIEDADFAHETTMLAKNQILQQASTAMLAQANASKQNVLSLLQG